jgi:hypothetical protein
MRHRARQRSSGLRNVLTTLPEDVVAAIDAAVGQHGPNRSVVIARALRGEIVLPSLAGGVDQGAVMG